SRWRARFSTWRSRSADPERSPAGIAPLTKHLPIPNAQTWFLELEVAWELEVAELEVDTRSTIDSPACMRPIMRIAGVLAAVVLPTAGPLVAQKPEGGASGPKKGDIVTIRGCVSWPLLVQAGFWKVDITYQAATPYTYRLSGDKNLVKPLQKEHADTIVEVTGVLKSTATPPPATRGKDYGKTKVYVRASGQNPP